MIEATDRIMCYAARPVSDVTKGRIIMPLAYIVDDEPHIRRLASISLKDAGFDTAEFSDGATVLRAVGQQKPDAILLDWMMPGLDGMEVLRQLRANPATRPVPILMMTARSDEVDRVLGLELGADDYVTKPFSPAELTARIDALYRRIGGDSSASSELLTQGPFVMNTRNHTLEKNGNRIRLTQVEYAILKLFMQNPGRALSREDILSAVWGRDYEGELKIVDVNIRRLRIKIEDDPTMPAYITTVWGYGYKWGL